MINTEKTTSAGFPEPEENKLSTEEMLHKIIDKTGVTKEQAAESLEKNNGDLLDAMIYVERTYGKASQAAQNVQQAQPVQTEQTAQSAQTAQAQQQAYTASQTYAAPENGAKAATEDFTNAAKKAGNFLIDNSLVIYHKCREVVELPMIVALAILILLFQISIPAAIVAMFFDVSYQFRGPQLGRGKFNFVLDAVYGMVRKLKASIMNAQ